ncbi:hypothetical protein GYMLUDRAFT_51816 [Collybiopsis luxurians FD-317 M1]|nr:hypothetical protein GYMLUDRAFT_51816 [Collybiopsis luxurians FD-317 M1]
MEAYQWQSKSLLSTNTHSMQSGRLLTVHAITPSAMATSSSNPKMKRAFILSTQIVSHQSEELGTHFVGKILTTALGIVHCIDQNSLFAIQEVYTTIVSNSKLREPGLSIFRWEIPENMDGLPTGTVGFCHNQGHGEVQGCPCWVISGIFKCKESIVALNIQHGNVKWLK